MTAFHMRWCQNIESQVMVLSVYRSLGMVDQCIMVGAVVAVVWTGGMVFGVPRSQRRLFVVSHTDWGRRHYSRLDNSRATCCACAVGRTSDRGQLIRRF